MAFERPDTIRSYPAAADLRTKIYYIATVNTGGSAAVAGLGVRSRGVLQNKANTGQAAAIMEDGDSPVYAGAAITPGDFLTSDATGLAIPITGGASQAGTAGAAITGSFCIGRAQTGGGSADLITMTVESIGLIAGSAV
jgi:hypothetical protein